MSADEKAKNIDIPTYWIFREISKSNNNPVIAGPIAEPSTIAAAAAAFIVPRYLVPKNSAQNALGSVVLAPDVIPKKTNPIKAMNKVSPYANNKKATIIGNWKNGINLAVPNLSNKTPDSIIVVIATPV